ncbi:MAG: acetyl-CoA carboxylase biotin carboxyl carrier protein subunit [Deltaproteobacteria bacterium]|nr:acetyl-CoA carboxylase biotin carboxyl carrier protein subunit [Deltaproteobacteria bacterium]MBN2673051.1 acetyl-CoA carboxylase biotin carboxyl carrier protein subunit [Deltaproteobacteria bacterium]
MAIEVVAPMVGKVVKIIAQPGTEVSEDDPILMLEAMKVEMPVGAPEDGVVKEIKVAEGDTVEGEQVVAILEES